MSINAVMPVLRPGKPCVTAWPSGDAVAVTTPVISPVFPSTPPHWRSAPLAEDAARPLGGFPLACACVVRPAVPFPRP